MPSHVSVSITMMSHANEEEAASHRLRTKDNLQMRIRYRDTLLSCRAEQSDRV